MSIRKSWDRILAFTTTHFPRGTFRLGRGVSERTIAATERRMGIYLPDDLKESYTLYNAAAKTPLRHDGDLMRWSDIEGLWVERCEWQAENGWGLVEGFSTDHIGRHKPDDKPTGAPIKPVFWTPLRLDVTADGGGNGIMIDLDPAKGGTRGQVISHSHEVGPQWVYAPSWAAYLEQLANDCDAGHWAYGLADGGSYTWEWRGPKRKEPKWR